MLNVHARILVHVHSHARILVHATAEQHSTPALSHSHIPKMTVTEPTAIATTEPAIVAKQVPAAATEEAGVKRAFDDIQSRAYTIHDLTEVEFCGLVVLVHLTRSSFTALYSVHRTSSSLRRTMRTTRSTVTSRLRRRRKRRSLPVTRMPARHWRRRPLLLRKSRTTLRTRNSVTLRSRSSPRLSRSPRRSRVGLGEGVCACHPLDLLSRHASRV